LLKPYNVPFFQNNYVCKKYVDENLKIIFLLLVKSRIEKL